MDDPRTQSAGDGAGDVSVGAEIVPDTMDWTWVAEVPCGECGYDASVVSRADVSDLIRSNASDWESFLSSGADLLSRPPQRWSALEYACHVRDVHVLYLERLQLMVEHVDPLYANWDQDASAVEDDYQSQSPADVRESLLLAAEAVASAFDGLTESGWTRTGRRSDGVSFTMDSFARYFVHDPIHHLWDVTGQRHHG